MDVGGLNVACSGPDNTGSAPRSRGNYRAYIEDLVRRKGPGADQPNRVQYKTLLRA